MAVTLDDLGAHRVCVETECRKRVGLDRRIELGVRPDGPRDLARGKVVRREAQPIAVTRQLERPRCELEPECDRLSVDRVGTAHHHGPGVLPARLASRSIRSAMAAASRSPAARHWSASAVSTTSLLVSP